MQLLIYPPSKSDPPLSEWELTAPTLTELTASGGRGHLADQTDKKQRALKVLKSIFGWGILGIWGKAVTERSCSF